MNGLNQCGAVERQCNIPEQEQAIGKATQELEAVIEALEGKVASARLQLAPTPSEPNHNLKSPEPLMSSLALALKGRAEHINALSSRLRNIVQTLEL